VQIQLICSALCETFFEIDYLLYASLFVKECLEEFYMTYDDTSLRGNGADLLTRVARKYLGDENKSVKHLELKVEPSYIFFPVSSQNITR